MVNYRALPKVKVGLKRMLFLGLGIVTNCTLTGSPGSKHPLLTGSVKTVAYGNTRYCMVFKGFKGQNAAMLECKTLNANLPLPKSEGEANEFRKITRIFPTWIGIRDLTKSGVKLKWKDVEGNPVGYAYVNLRVINLIFIVNTVVFDYDQSGNLENQADMEQLLT